MCFDANDIKIFKQGESMSVIPFNNVAYGLSQPGISVFPPPITSNRAPTTADKAPIGSTWVHVPANDYYVLTSITNNSSLWQVLATGTGALDQLTSNAGVALPAAGNINVVGGGATNISTSAAGSTLTVAVISSPSFAGTTTVATGLTATTGNIVASAGNINATLGSMSAGTTITAGTGITSTTGNISATAGQVNAGTSVNATTSVGAGTTVTAGTGLTVSTFTEGVVQSNGAGVFSSSKGTDGQLLISSTAGAPAWANISAGANITITNAANAITIAANAGAATLNFTATAVTPYVVAANDDFIAIDASGGAKTVQLPNAPATGRIFVIKDQNGNAAANNITVTTVGGAVNIDGATSFVMTTNFQSLQVLFDGTKYEIY